MSICLLEAGLGCVFTLCSISAFKAKRDSTRKINGFMAFMSLAAIFVIAPTSGTPPTQ